MSRQVYAITAILGFAAACSSDKPDPEGGHDGSAESAAEAARLVVLPPLTPLGKPAAELEAEGWTAVETQPELPIRLRDSAPAAPEIGSAALRRELLALASPGNTAWFDTLGGFADTVRLIEQALMRRVAEQREKREAVIVDSLEREMEPRDPDLDAVSYRPESMRPGWQTPPPGDVPVSLVSFREEPRPPVLAFSELTMQQSQTKTFQVAPGVEGTETSSSDGSSVTNEVGFKGENSRGSGEASAKITVTMGDEFERNGEVGGKREISTKKKFKIDGNDVEEVKEAKGEERLGYCPDANGVVRGRYKHWLHDAMRVTIKGVTGYYDITIEADFALTVQVDDDARATDLLVEGYTNVHKEIGQYGAGNSTPVIVNGRAEGRAQGVEVHGATRELGSFHFRLPPPGPGVKLEWIQDGLIEELVKAISEGRSLAKEAEKRWRNGACVEVIPHPETKALRFGGKTAFRIEVKHKREKGGSFPYPVRIMTEKYHPTAINLILGKLDPPGTLTTPATFHYTAPAKGSPEGESWRGSPTPDRAFPMSISRRGIGGRNFYIPYDTLRLGYALVFKHRVTSEKLGVERDVTMKAVVREMDTPDADGNTFAGRGRYKGSFRKYNPSCDNKSRTDYETLPLVGEAKGIATADDYGDGQTGLTFTISPLEDEGMDLIPVAQSLMLTEGKAQHSRTFTMQSDRCRGTLTHVTEWSATQIK